LRVKGAVGVFAFLAEGCNVFLVLNHLGFDGVLGRGLIHLGWLPLCDILLMPIFFMGWLPLVFSFLMVSFAAMALWNCSIFLTELDQFFIAYFSFSFNLDYF